MVSYISGNTEIMRVAELVAAEKGISAESVIDAIEQAVKVAARKKYGAEYDIHVNMDRKTGEFSIYRRLEIVENVEDVQTQISLDQVKKSTSSDQEVKIGDHVTQDLPPVDLKRLVAQVVKQVIVQKVKFAEREKQFAQYEDKVGEIVNGVVKKVSPRGVLLDLAGVEAFLDRNDSIPDENLSQNDRVRACVKEVVRRDNGVQIYLSRASNEFMAALFTQEVPEIYDGIINIKAVSREPGSRAKIAVQSVESNLDPVGACVGVRGSRVQVVINELKGEKIDIIEWSQDIATFVVNAIVPARALKVVIDEERHRIETVVSEQDYSLAIGRRGQNARLASRLTGWNIDILTEEAEANLRKEEFDKVTEIFIKHLKLDDILTRVLIAEGVTEVEEILMIEADDLAGIEGFDEEKAAELIKAAEKFVKTKTYRKIKWEKLGLDESLMQLDKLDPNIAFTLQRNNIKTIEQLSDLSRDEFKEIISADILDDDKKIDDLIMSARDIVFASQEKVSNQ